MRRKIAFIAVSGVRVRNTLLDASAVTLPGFVSRGKEIASLPSLALLTLASLTPPDFEVTYLDMPLYDESALDLLDCDMAAISALTAKCDLAYQIAARLRSRGIIVVIGGLHAKACPQEVAEHADAVAAGEGEILWPRILQDWCAGNLQSIYSTSASQSYDLSMSPQPRYDLLELENYNRITVQTTRGCPHDCEFCAASKVFGRFRKKPVELVLRDIDAIRARWPHPFVEFADDNTFVDHEWSKQLLRGLIGRNVKWFTETDVSVARDTELLELLAPAGCRQLLIGFESPNHKVLDGIDARNWKLKQRDVYLSAIEAIQSHGVSVNGTFIVGNDADTPDVFEEIDEFVNESGLQEVQVTVLTPFPGTRLYQRLKAEKRLLQDAHWDRCTLFDATFNPKQMSLQQLSEGMNWLYERLYSREATSERKRRFFAMMRTSKKVAV